MAVATLMLLVGSGAAVWGYVTATQNPFVREASVALPDWPKGAAPLKVVLISDIHVAGPDMPPERLTRIVGQINRLTPDLVLIAGDMVSDKMVATRRYPAAEAMRPLTDLKPRLGTLAVLGNHDHWRNGRNVQAALAAAGVKVLDNEAVQAGPLAIGGVDDVYTRNGDLPNTVAAMRRLRGAKLLLSHSPDPFVRLPRDITLMLAGHTHCGQISPPLIGPIATASKTGRRYACGKIVENGRTLIVTAGLGTSNLPLRIGAVPDLWLLTLGGRTR